MNYSQVSSEHTSCSHSAASIRESSISSDVRIIQGQYLGELPSSKGRLKYIQIQQNDEELLIKLPKLIGYTLAGKLQPGMMLQIWVRPKKDYLKALMVVPAETDMTEDVALGHLCEAGMAPPSDDAAELSDLPEGTTVTPKHKVQTFKVCTKGKCHKQGSRHVMQALEAAVSEGKLGRHISINPTGCLKNCKQGPTIQVSPGSETYSFVRPQDASTLVRHHAGDRSSETKSD
ncbi:MAG: (2Fe-2S) ferredoxin domain-containing protein [Cyanobacteria bacterium P01_A01_bin.37]